MRFYTQKHPHYCGIDLHARRMYLCILDQQGEVRLASQHERRSRDFLQAHRSRSATIWSSAVECMFTWYWLADLCARGRNRLRPRSRAVHESHSRRQSQERQDRLPEDRRPAARRHDPASLCLSRRDALDSRSAAPPDVIWCETGRTAGPRPEHQQPIQPARDREEDRLQEPIAQESPSASPILRSRPVSLRSVSASISTTPCSTKSNSISPVRPKLHDAHTFALLRSVPGIGKILALVHSL